MIGETKQVPSKPTSSGSLQSGTTALTSSFLSPGSTPALSANLTCSSHSRSAWSLRSCSAWKYSLSDSWRAGERGSTYSRSMLFVSVDTPCVLQ